VKSKLITQAGQGSCC